MSELKKMVEIEFIESMTPKEINALLNTQNNKCNELEAKLEKYEALVRKTSTGWSKAWIETEIKAIKEGKW